LTAATLEKGGFGQTGEKLTWVKAASGWVRDYNGGTWSRCVCFRIVSGTFKAPLAGPFLYGCWTLDAGSLTLKAKQKKTGIAVFLLKVSLLASGVLTNESP
jgi:hypothetical protein